MDGSNQACKRCDGFQQVEEPTTAAPKTMAAQPHPVIISQEREAEHYPATFFRVRPGQHQSHYTKPLQYSKLMKRDADYKARKYRNCTISN